MCCNLRYSDENQPCPPPPKIAPPPLSLRLAEADLAIIDRAAKLQGRSRTQFMRDAAVKAAEEALMENTLIKMSPRDFATFMEALDRLAEPSARMIEVMNRVAPWEKNGDKV